MNINYYIYVCHPWLRITKKILKLTFDRAEQHGFLTLRSPLRTASLLSATTAALVLVTSANSVGLISAGTILVTSVPEGTGMLSNIFVVSSIVIKHLFCRNFKIEIFVRYKIRDSKIRSEKRSYPFHGPQGLSQNEISVKLSSPFVFLYDLYFQVLFPDLPMGGHTRFIVVPGSRIFLVFKLVDKQINTKH